MSLKSHSNARFCFLDGFKNELRHLCPKKAAWCWRHPCASQTWQFSRLRGLAVANAFRNRLLSSSSSPCLTCSIYVVWNCLETGPISGAYFCFRKGDAASMWHILVRLVDGCREIWGSCAICVGIRSLILANELELSHLCPKKAAWCWEKNMGGNQRRRLQKIYIYISTIITIGIVLGLFWAMFDNLGSLWWSFLSSKDPLIFGPP